jgi:hypothetical protein
MGAPNTVNDVVGAISLSVVFVRRINGLRRCEELDDSRRCGCTIVAAAVIDVVLEFCRSKIENDVCLDVLVPKTIIDSLLLAVLL